MPQSHSADQHTALRGRDTEYKKLHAIKKKIKLKQPALLDAQLDRIQNTTEKTRTKCNPHKQLGAKISNESTTEPPPQNLQQPKPSAEGLK